MKRRVMAAVVSVLTCAGFAAGDIDDLIREREASRQSAEETAAKASVRPSREPVGVVEADIAGASNAFAFDLYARLAAEEGNVFVSPSSIHTALSMTYAGARGRTETQMAAVLHVPTLPVTVGSDAGGPGPSLQIVEERPVPQLLFHGAYAKLLTALKPG